MMSGLTFEEVQQTFTAKFRALMSGALQLSIRRQREVIAQDLLQFAYSRTFSLTISEKEIEFLVQHEMYSLIERMITLNTLLLMKSKDMNVDQRFQADMIK